MVSLSEDMQADGRQSEEISLFALATTVLRHRWQIAACMVLGAGMEVYYSHGDQFEVSTPEDALRMMEGARVYRLLDHPLVIVSGGFGSGRHTEAARMATELEAMGVPADRIIEESKSANTHDHGRFIPSVLADRQVPQFVLDIAPAHRACFPSVRASR